MSTPHKHAELIKKWADDPTLVIEYYDPNYPQAGWRWTSRPAWISTIEYRIKPTIVKREGWMLVKRHAFPSSPVGNGVYANSFVYTDERDVPARTGGFIDFIKIKVEWEEEV